VEFRRKSNYCHDFYFHSHEKLGRFFAFRYFYFLFQSTAAAMAFSLSLSAPSYVVMQFILWQITLDVKTTEMDIFFGDKSIVCYYAKKSASFQRFH
jgi:hypothetical protein